MSKEREKEIRQAFANVLFEYLPRVPNLDEPNGHAEMLKRLALIDDLMKVFNEYKE